MEEELQPRHHILEVEVGPWQVVEAEEQEDAAAAVDSWEEAVDNLHKQELEVAGNLHRWHSTTDYTTGHN